MNNVENNYSIQIEFNITQKKQQRLIELSTATNDDHLIR